MYDTTTSAKEKEFIKSIYTNFIDTINGFIDLVKIAANNTGHSKMLENKDFSKIPYTLGIKTKEFIIENYNKIE